VAALSQVGQGTFDVTSLTDPAGFSGIDGVFRLGRDGVAERALAVWRVAAQSFQVIDPAPGAFGPPGF